MSTGGLEPLHDLMARHVETGKMPGLITLVARHDGAQNDVHVDVIGTKAIDDDAPLQRDAIFRIASLTKPITAAAAMILVDDGVLELSGAVDEFLPELADRRVLRSLDGPLDDTVPAKRAITVDDLLTFRMGFGTIMAPPDTYPIQTAERELQLGTLGPPWPPPPHTPDEWIRHFASLPLMHQPGEQWMYNTGSTGARHPAGTRRRPAPRSVPAPTAVRAAGHARHRVQRVARPTQPLHDRLRTRPRNRHAQRRRRCRGQLLEPTACLAQRGGVAGVDDRRLLGLRRDAPRRRHTRRRADPQRTLGRADDHRSPDARATRLGGVFLREQDGWGLGMLVPAADAPASSSKTSIPRGFGWDGGTGTTWRSDRTRGLTGVLFTQRAMTSPEPPAVFNDFWTGAYGSISD